MEFSRAFAFLEASGLKLWQVGRQKHRANITASTPEQYWRLSVFVPFVDGLLVILNDRFMQFSDVAAGLSAFIPALAVKHTFSFGHRISSSACTTGTSKCHMV